MCNVAEIVQTVVGDSLHFMRVLREAAIRPYVDEAADSIKSAFDKALKNTSKTQYANAGLVLDAASALVEGEAASADICNRRRRAESKYPEANLKYLLPKLCTLEDGGILRYDSNSGLYSVSDPIYRAYALAHFQKQDAHPATDRQSAFEQTLLSLLTDKIKLDGDGELKITFNRVPAKR